jgi:dihydroflavonol-4-reductase
MTDVVTGANGYIGNVLVKELLKRGRKVRAIVRNTSNLKSLENLENSDLEIFTGDISDLKSLCNAFADADAVYHLAGKISLMPGDRHEIYNVNYLCAKNVIQACKECNVKRLIYTSTIHALIEPPSDKIINEEIPYCVSNNKSIYDRSKALASVEVLKATQDGLDAVIVNPTGVIGPYDFQISALTKTFIDFSKKRLKLAIEGAYDFVDVRDVAIGHILAYEKGKTGENYILSGERIKVSQLMKILEESTGIKAPEHYLPVNFAKFIASFMPIYYKITGIKPYFTKYSVDILLSNSCISHEKATKELGYKPRPVKDSVKDAIIWLKEIGYI